MIQIGDLVKFTKGVGTGLIGIILDCQDHGRLYPSIRLTIKTPCGLTIKTDNDYVQKIGDNNDR